MKHLALICSVAIGFTIRSGAYGVTLNSPPLPVINNDALHIRLHRSWLITHRGDPYSWHTSSYDFEVSRPHAALSQNTKFDVEVLIYSVARAQMHGDLVGNKYRTPSGLAGVVHTESSVANERDWYFAIPIGKTRGALIIRLVNLKGPLLDQKNTAYSVFSGIYFSSPRGRPPVTTSLASDFLMTNSEGDQIINSITLASRQDSI